MEMTKTLEIFIAKLKQLGTKRILLQERGAAAEDWEALADEYEAIGARANAWQCRQRAQVKSNLA